MGTPHTITGWAALERIKLGQILDNLNRLLVNIVGTGHLAPDATNTVTPAVPTTIANLATACNALKAAYNAHLAVAGAVHIAADATNDIAAADSDDTVAPTKSLAILNELDGDFNAHLALAAATGHYRADTRTAAVATSSATDLATGIAKYLVLEAAYLDHIAGGVLQDAGDYDRSTLSSL